MRERPILFSGPMVRAILEGRKTQTRRVVKPQPPAKHDVPLSMRMGARFRWGVSEHPKGEGPSWELWPDGPVACPYGEPGDRLWVRETWSQDATSMYPCPPAWYWASDGDDLKGYGIHTCPQQSRGNYADCLACWEGKHGKFRWRPSIFMPRHLSRITLEVVKVRVERLQEISEEDAIAEGMKRIRDACHVIPGFDYDKVGLCHTSAVTPYEKLWEHINGPGSWDLNPWVWVVEFKKV